MTVSDIQMLLAELGRYAGAIDGDPGPKTWAAVAHTEPAGGRPWPGSRRLIAAGQFALAYLGFDPGAIDGYAGHNTAEALTAWRSAKAGTTAAVSRVALEGLRADPNQQLYPRQRRMAAYYGPPGGPDCTAGSVDLAYPMIIAWNRSATIQRFSCHRLLADPLTSIFREALAHYGQADIERLELNLFGGCFNYRPMRGGKALSTHAYGAAVDLNPEKNQLRWGADRAQFAGPEYQPFWSIVMAHGGTPAGYAWGKDWMHFQFARL